MSYVRGVGVNQTVFDAGPDEWTPVLDAAALDDGAPRSGIAADTPVLLTRNGNDIYAIHDRCNHRGCPLSDGELQGHVITCSCHGSQFDARDGTLLRGPAITSQPAFDTRTSDGRIEVRRSTRG
jgi:nitrite reductase/ring-hydroxylating ferredoxin subunit